jgi:hypothetical protein
MAEGDQAAAVSRLVLGCALLLAIAGCESARSAATPGPTSYDAVGELVGTWIGTWGNTLLTLVVIEHTESAPYSGLYVGSWLVAGGRYPGIAGILTYARAGAPATTRFNGWIYSSRPFTALVLAEPPDGQLHIRLRGTGAGALTGEGQSTFGWGPQGFVELTRR